MTSSERLRKRRKLAWGLGVGFALSILLAVGPGILLVNEARMFFGLPILYAWAIFWWLVWGGIALAADRFFWQQRGEEEQ